MADGPVIQKTSQEALDAGIHFERALELTARAVRESGIPAIAMTYCNLIYSRGLAEAFAALARAGVQGVILPDLPLEEGGDFEIEAARAGLDLVYLCAPTTPESSRSDTTLAAPSRAVRASASQASVQASRKSGARRRGTE